MSFQPGEEWRETAFGLFGRLGLTLLVILLLLILSTFPFRFGNFGEVRPAFILMAVYYWAVMRPETLAPLPAFLLGLAYDLIAGHPLGLNAMTVIAVQWMMKPQRKFFLGQGFLVLWAGLALVALLAALLQWALFSLFYFSFMSIKAPLVSVLLTTAFFPLVVLPLAALNKALSGPTSSMHN